MIQHIMPACGSKNRSHQWMSHLRPVSDNKYYSQIIEIPPKEALPNHDYQNFKVTDQPK